MVDATILLPNFNNERVLPHMFHHLRRNVDCSKINLVVVDDGSEDEGVKVAKDEIARSGFASAELIERKHEGIVSALNAGLDACKTEFVFRIDGDATVETPDWISRLGKLLSRYPEVGLIGGQVLFDHGTVHSFGRNVISPIGLHDIGTCPLEPIGRRSFDSIVLRPRSEFFQGAVYEVDTLLGVCAAFRLSDAKEVGGFDQRFNPVWIEDDDFGLAIRLLGRRVIVDPSIRVLHRVSLRNSRQPGVTKGNTSGGTTTGLCDTKSVLRQLLPEKIRLCLQILRGQMLSQHPGSFTIPTEDNIWRANILKRHYAAWQSKWGFCPLNPAMTEIYRRYWETMICWNVNPTLHEKSERFLATFQSP